jgi:uncharacterized lipoprotein YmbA
MRHRTVHAVLCGLAALLAGCATPRSDFYTLSASAKPAGAAAASSVAVGRSSALTGARDTRPSVAVGPVSVPAIVDRPQFVVRTAPNEVAIDEFHRWGAPLQSEIARVVAEDLSVLLGTSHVAVFPKPTAVGARYRAAIDVMVFDSAPGAETALDAVWTVRDSQSGAQRPGRTTVRETVREQGYAPLAAAHSRALVRLSADIAEAIRAMERGSE